MPTKAAVRARSSGRTGHLGGEVDATIVINGEDADEADSVAAAAAAGVDAAAAADVVAVAIGCPPLCLSGTMRLQGQTLTNMHAD